MTDRPTVALWTLSGDDQTQDPYARDPDTGKPTGINPAAQLGKWGLGLWYDFYALGVNDPGAGAKAAIASIEPALAQLRPTDIAFMHNPFGFAHHGRGMRFAQMLALPEWLQREVLTAIRLLRQRLRVLVYLGHPYAADEPAPSLSDIGRVLDPLIYLGCELAFDATGGTEDNPVGWKSNPMVDRFLQNIEDRNTNTWCETNDRQDPCIIDSNWYEGELAQGAHVEPGSIILPYSPSVPVVTPAWLREVAARGHIPAIRPHELAGLGMTLGEVWAGSPIGVDSPPLNPPPIDSTVPATPIDHVPDAGKKVKIYARTLHPEEPWLSLTCEVITSGNAREVALIDANGGTVASVPAGAVGNLPGDPVKLRATKPGAYTLRVTGNGETFETAVGLGYEQDWFVIDREGAPWTPDDNDQLATLRGQNRVILRGANIGSGFPGASSKIKPGRGTDAATRTLMLRACSVLGDPVLLPRVDVAAAGEWGVGVWLWSCAFKGVNSLPADLRMIRNCYSEHIGSDAGQNCPLVYDYTVRNLRKPPGSDAHPDLLQGFFKVDPGPVFWVKVTNDDELSRFELDEIFGQSLFLRCPVRVPAFIARDWRVNARPEWKSQIKGVDMDYLELRDIAITGQEFLITNDGENNRKVTARHSLVQNLSAKAVRIEQDSGVVAG